MILDPSEFWIGTLSSVTDVSLVIPIEKSGEFVLVGIFDAMLTAVILTGPHAFSCFQIGPDSPWKGMVIPNVRFEVEISSLVSGGSGSVRRRSDCLSVSAAFINSFGSTSDIVLAQGLPGTEPISGSFSEWQIVLGAGPDKRVLWRSDPDQRN